MRSLKPTLIAAVLVMTLLASGIASADRRGGGHYGHHRGWGHHHGPRVRVGVGIGWSFWGPWWYYPPYYPRYYYPYYPPAVAIPSTPPVYIERGEPTPSSTPPGVWYYCPDSKAYYPYVKECPSGWQTVPAQPPPAQVR
jgi:hypothetical protein